ncbi:CsbD family protein [Parahaliea sp. F7430]|uniref:CsbD family protein n=1 Tax=Sediminihaliea albiluteola TaxID=2758564 RepID=A0A7W2TUK1_9GAMM|nr:CsbD family protein [Sediminihaliea albiluteola]
MNKDQVKGKAKEVKGEVKEATGELVGNEKLEGKGKLEKIIGKAQGKYGDLKKDIKDKMDKS